jgi:hypothetical protein
MPELSLTPEQAPRDGLSSRLSASTGECGAQDARAAHAASQGPSGAPSDFDRDPEAIAWARTKIQHAVDLADRGAREAKTEEQREKWRHAAWFMRQRFLGPGEGCVITAFDERLPAHRARMDHAMPAPGLMQCPTCGPHATEPHPRLPIDRCANCKTHAPADRTDPS